MGEHLGLEAKDKQVVFDILAEHGGANASQARQVVEDDAEVKALMENKVARIISKYSL